ncbi:RNA polymerase sigma factor, sigma-70 family [Lentibacillus persicus]|uniref:RNA polymerase sigma factor, sigma-70 family n=1 Tax=Lentibacillus persicus TaxID=640948 RepID=A0A1I1S6J2_9BACI|nr:sigma-70 family RNA polymerase sigma factor [Lentibacillus persicus]SFD42129.1 RNA polymerase sigma factor, sigma-70 family [Lentibacillus persicus]
MDNRISFEEIFEQNKRRIHYQIHKLNIHDPHEEFFQEGLVAMWRAYESYQPDKGPMATYFNYMIRNRMIDAIRKDTRKHEALEKIIHQRKTQLTDGNYHRKSDATNPLVDAQHLPMHDPNLWNNLKSQLTDKQWKWVQHRIILDMPYKEIAEAENVSVEAVKSWGKQVRKKFKDPEFRKAINLDNSL